MTKLIRRYAAFWGLNGISSRIYKYITMIFRGFGFLSAILPLAGIFLPIIFNIDSNISTTIGCMVGCLIAALVGWEMNNSPAKIQATKGSKTISTTIYRHEAFYLKMEIFSAATFCMAALALAEIIYPQYTSIISPVSSIVFAGIIVAAGYRYYTEKKVRKWLKKASPASDRSSVQTSKAGTNQSTKIPLKKSTPLPKSKEAVSKMTEEQQRKRAVFTELKQQSGKLKEFEKSAHSQYLPS